MIPGAFEGETVTRRRFMTGSCPRGGRDRGCLVRAARARLCDRADLQTAAALLGGHRLHRRLHQQQLRAGGHHASPRGSARPASPPPMCASTTLRSTRTPTTAHTPYIAISTRCAHLGCPVRWVDAAERFICPCHGGVYDLLGRRVGGPPVQAARPLPHARERRPGRTVQRALQRQQRAETLLPARPRRAARRHRPVPLPLAPDRAQAY